MRDKLKEYFCIYLDILGYSNRIKSTSENNLEMELNKFINNVTNRTSLLQKFGKIDQFKFRLFSDNILIALPVTKKTINVLHVFIKHLVDYQIALIQANYFIRGSITKGKLYIDNNTIWGPALIESVELEKSTVYPFICLSKSLLDLFVENDLLTDVNKSLSIPIIEIISENYFLNYLETTIFMEDDQPEQSLNTFLTTHKEKIECNLKTTDDKNVWNKYAMLAKYHNEFCNTHKNCLPQFQYLKIKDCLFEERTFKRKYLLLDLK